MGYLAQQRKPLLGTSRGQKKLTPCYPGIKNPAKIEFTRMGIPYSVGIDGLSLRASSTTTPTILDQISAEKTKVSERLARLDTDRATVATQLTDLETAERVLMRVSKTPPARKPSSRAAAEGRRPRATYSSAPSGDRSISSTTGLAGASADATSSEGRAGFLARETHPRGGTFRFKRRKARSLRLQWRLGYDHRGSDATD